MLKKTLKVGAVLLVTIALSACMSMGEPKRDAYTGKDQVGQITKDMIIGDWEITILNPIEGEQREVKAKTHYMADGSLTVDAAFESGMGVVELEVIGNWTIEGDKIKQVATDVREKSESSIGILIKVFKKLMLKNNNTELNLYEASANRLLIVADDGQAQEYHRLK